jgi:hypothetical protein
VRKVGHVTADCGPSATEPLSDFLVAVAKAKVRENPGVDLRDVMDVTLTQD